MAHYALVRGRSGLHVRGYGYTVDGGVAAQYALDPFVEPRFMGSSRNHFFSAASSQCRDAFIDGHYHGCISLAQALAEGLSSYLGGLHQVEHQA